MTVEEQIKVLKAASKKACQSKEAAREFLDDAGITGLLQEESSIAQGLKEAEEIHSGKREGKTFDNFLNELP